MKTIFILFTQYKDWFARFLSIIRHHNYSHVAIALDDDRNCFYSFNVKGFCCETPEKYKRHGVTKSILYEVKIKDENYNKICKKIHEAYENKNKMKYSFCGIALCLLHIPFHRKNQYFCSEFVADLLKKSKTIMLSKCSSLYLPEHLRIELEKYLRIKKFANVI